MPRSSHAGAGGSSPSISAEVRDVPPGPDTTKEDKQSTVTSPPSSTKVPVPAEIYPPVNENANTVDPLA